ncbi:MAG: thioredoxin family protein [Alphaproteobacteria bacterium]|nr:thioredoxin family protein [Alphaproteobacteria bacterium]
MTLPPRRWLPGLAVLLLLALPGGPAAAETRDDRLPLPELGDDGLHKQPWFQETFLDLSEDLAEATESGRRLVIIWEQRGCPYCKQTHAVNFRIPRIVDYVKANFFVLQLNMWGDREVTDFDGQAMTEKQLARKWRVLFTPTFQFFPDAPGAAQGRRGDAAEVHRVPGYFKPFHFYFQFRYVKEKGYETEPSFQRWLDGYGDKLRAQGVDVEAALWKDTLELPENF